MITTAEEYFANLFKINETYNVPSLAVLLPSSENIYNIDLNSRTVEAPEYLSVTDDHNSETIYFMVDRYYDNMDLSQTSCVIQYINAKKEGRLFVVPYYDIESYHNMNKMLIPWCIEGEATKAAGEVTFSIRFFKVDDGDHKSLIYNLNTIPQKSLVKTGINILDYHIVELTKEEFEAEPSRFYIKKNDKYIKAPAVYNNKTVYYALTEGYNYSARQLEDLIQRIDKVEREFNVYWYDAGKDI